MFQVNKKKHQKDVNDVVLVFLLLTLNIFHTFFQFFYDFEQLVTCWEEALESNSILENVLGWLLYCGQYKIAVVQLSFNYSQLYQNFCKHLRWRTLINFTTLFSYLLKTLKNVWFSNVVRVYRKKTNGMKWVKSSIANVWKSSGKGSVIRLPF